MSNCNRLLNICHLPFSICHLLIALVLLLPAVVHADPSQDAVFKSISNNVDSSVSGKTVLAGAMVIVGLMLLMAFLSRRQDKRSTPRTMNSQAKLMRELIKTAGLKPAEARQLRTLADKLAKAGRPVDSPITLMLATVVGAGRKIDRHRVECPGHDGSLGDTLGGGAGADERRGRRGDGGRRTGGDVAFIGLELFFLRTRRPAPGSSSWKAPTPANATRPSRT